MANGDPTALLDQQLQAMQQLAPAPQPKRQVSGLDALVNTFASIQDPLARELAKGLVETEISKAVGFRFTIPDPEDARMIQAAKQIELSKMNREIAKNTVEEVKALFLDKSPEEQRALGISGVDVDTLLESNPDLFVAAAQKAGVRSLTKGLLSLAGTADTDTASAAAAFQQKKAKEQVDVLATQAQGIEAAGKIAKVEESGVSKAQAEAAFKASGEALGVDVNPFFANPLKTDRGALAFLDATQQVGRKGPAFAGKIAEAFLKNRSDDIGGVLEDLPVDNAGLIHVEPGKGEAQKANALYVALGLIKLSQTSGQNMADIFAQIEDVADKAVGFDTKSLGIAARSEIARLEKTGGRGAADQIRGFIESL